ncbi:hypothetical protein ACA910_003864 [Epithemia clementina (nom. ined.)]
MQAAPAQPSSQSHLQLGNGFNVTALDEGQDLSWRDQDVATIFGESGANVYVRATASTVDEKDGRLYVDCGIILLQQSSLSKKANVLSIACLAKDKTDDNMPKELVIPIGLIIGDIDHGNVCSKGGLVQKAKIVICTSQSLNFKSTLEPMTITLKMSLVGANSFMTL